MRRFVGALAAVGLALIACGNDDDGRASTTSTTLTPEATEVQAPAELDPLRLTAIQYLGVINAQLPLVADDTSDLQLDEVAQGVYGSTVARGTQILVFADSPASRVRALAVVVDLDITEGSLPSRLIGTAAGVLADDPAAVVHAFNDRVVPKLSSLSPGPASFDLDQLDLILVVDPSVVTFTYVGPGGDLPPFLASG